MAELQKPVCLADTIALHPVSEPSEAQEPAEAQEPRGEPIEVQFAGHFGASPVDVQDWNPETSKPEQDAPRDAIDGVLRDIAKRVAKAFSVARKKKNMGIMGETDPPESEEDMMLPEEKEALEEQETAETIDKILSELRASRIARRIIENSFLDVGARRSLSFLNRNGDLVVFAQSDAWQHITATFGKPLSTEFLENLAASIKNDEARGEFPPEAKGIACQTILDHIALHRQRREIVWRVDMFSNEPCFELLESAVQIMLPHKPLVAGPYDPTTIDDFRQHFPRLDEFVDFIAASRFAADRKRAFLWWRATSDFGKGLVMGLLRDIGAATEVSVKEIEVMLEGKPSGLAPSMFRRSLVLWVDEFRNVRPELKMLQSEVSLSPKFQARQSVEVFAKVFTSAEIVPALATTSGVETQFANRFSFWQSEGRIADRELFQNFGKGRYAADLRNYLAATLNEKIDRYISLGREAATKRADAFLEDFHNRHSIAHAFGDITEDIASIARDFVAFAAREHDLRSNYDRVLYDTAAGPRGISAPAKLFEQFVDATFAHSEKKLISLKRDEVFTAVSGGAWDGRARLYKATDGNRPRKLLLIAPEMGHIT